jgi:hypothetical protein
MVTKEEDDLRGNFFPGAKVAVGKVEEIRFEGGLIIPDIPGNADHFRSISPDERG